MGQDGSGGGGEGGVGWGSAEKRRRAAAAAAAEGFRGFRVSFIISDCVWVKMENY